MTIKLLNEENYEQHHSKLIFLFQYILIFISALDSLFTPFIYAFWDKEFQDVFDGVARHYLGSSNPKRKAENIGELSYHVLQQRYDSIYGDIEYILADV